MKMRIELHEITVRDLVEGYRDNQEGGVTGYGGRLDIRPPFQREFVYKDTLAEAGRPDIAATWKANPFRGELCSGDSGGWVRSCYDAGD